MGKRLSLRARLLLAVAALAAVGLLVADVATYSSLRSFLLDRTDSTLDEDGPHPAPPRPRRRDPVCASRDVRTGAFARRRRRSIATLPGATVPGESVPSPAMPDTVTPPAGQTTDGEAVSYFTVPGEEGGGEYRVRASIAEDDRAMLVLATSLSDVSTLDRLLLIELVVTAVVLACDHRARPLARPAGPAPARGDRRHGIRDRGRRPLPQGGARGRTNGGGPPRPRAQRHARPDRGVLPRAGGVGAQASPLRRRRLARAADTARGGQGVRGALRPGRGRAAGRPRALDEGNQPRVRAHERPRRGSPPARAPRRGPAARVRARSARRGRRRGGRDRADRRPGTADRAPRRNARSSSATACASARSSTTCSRTSAPTHRPGRLPRSP